MRELGGGGGGVRGVNGGYRDQMFVVFPFPPVENAVGFCLF